MQTQLEHTFNQIRRAQCHVQAKETSRILLWKANAQQPSSCFFVLRCFAPNNTNNKHFLTIPLLKVSLHNSHKVIEEGVHKEKEKKKKKKKKKKK